MVSLLRSALGNIYRGLRFWNFKNTDLLKMKWIPSDGFWRIVILHFIPSRSCIFYSPAYRRCIPCPDSWSENQTNYDHFALIGLHLFVNKNYTGRQVQLVHMQLAKTKNLAHPPYLHPEDPSWFQMYWKQHLAFKEIQMIKRMVLDVWNTMLTVIRWSYQLRPTIQDKKNSFNNRLSIWTGLLLYSRV